MELTEDEFKVIDAIAEGIARKLCGNSICSFEDLKQQAWIIALEHLGDYQEDRGSLSSYTRKVIYTRILNYKRDNFYDRRGCLECRRGGACDLCQVCWERQSLKTPFSGCGSPVDRLSGESPLESAMINEWSVMVAGMGIEEAAGALGVPHLSKLPCKKCGQKFQPSQYDDCPTALDGKFKVCRGCRNIN